MLDCAKKKSFHSFASWLLFFFSILFWIMWVFLYRLQSHGLNQWNKHSTKRNFIWIYKWNCVLPITQTIFGIIYLDFYYILLGINNTAYSKQSSFSTIHLLTLPKMTERSRNLIAKAFSWWGKMFIQSNKRIKSYYTLSISVG